MVIPQAPYRWESLWVPYMGNYPIWDYPAMASMALIVFGSAWITYSRRPALPLCAVCIGMAVCIGFYSKTRDMRLPYTYNLDTVELTAGMEPVVGELGILRNEGRKARQ